MTLSLLDKWHQVAPDLIRAMIDHHRPLGLPNARAPRSKHRPTPPAVAAIGAYCAMRQRPRKGEPDAADYFDETLDQISWATKYPIGTVRDALSVLADAGWCVTIRKGGRARGARRRLVLPGDACGPEPAPNATDERGPEPAPNATDACGPARDHRGPARDHRGLSRGPGPASPLDPQVIHNQPTRAPALRRGAARFGTNGTGTVTLGEVLADQIDDLAGDDDAELDRVRRNTDAIGRKPLTPHDQAIIDRNTTEATT